MRYYQWPEQNIHYPSFTIPRSLIVRHSEDGPKPSTWAELTKPEKSILVATLSCFAIGNNSPTEALLAAFCGMKTRKAVRNAISKLEQRKLLTVKRGADRTIQPCPQTEEDSITIPSFLITDGHWSAIGENCPSAHSFYIALMALTQDQNPMKHSNKTICDIAGISVRHYKATVEQLMIHKLVLLWDWPSLRLIPSTNTGFYYKKSYLESFNVQ